MRRRVPGKIYTRQNLRQDRPEVQQCKCLFPRNLPAASATESDRSPNQTPHRIPKQELAIKQAVIRKIASRSYVAKGATKKAKGGSGVKQVSAKEMDRWWAETQGDDRFIVKYLPPSARHYTDNVNGRFLLFQDSIGFDRKSFSWTKRGNHQACLMLLQTAWQRHCEHYNTECPLPQVLFENHEF